MMYNYLGKTMHTIKLSIYEYGLEYWMEYKWQEERKRMEEKIKEQMKDHTYCNYMYIGDHQHLQRKDYRLICLLAREIKYSFIRLKEQRVEIR